MAANCASRKFGRLGRAFRTALLQAVALGFFLANGLVANRADASEPASPPRVDPYGDPLPPGAIARLGTNRFRHMDQLTGAAFSPDNRLLACSYAHGAIILWDATTGKVARQIDGANTYPYSAITFSADGKMLFSGESEGSIAVWNVADGRLSQRLGARIAEDRIDVGASRSIYFRYIAVSADGHIIVAITRDHLLRVWRIESALVTVPIRRVIGEHDCRPALSQDGRTLVMASEPDHQLTIKNLEAGTEIVRRNGHVGGVACLALSPNAKTLAAAGVDLTLHVSKCGNGKLLWSAAKPNGDEPPSSVQFCPDGKSLMARAAWDTGRPVPNGTSIRFWRVANGEQLDRRDLRPAYADARCVAITADGNLYATSRQHAVDVLNTKTNRSVARLIGHAGGIATLSVSPDGRFVASVNPFILGTLRMWDVGAGKQIWQVASDATSLLFAPDGLMFVTKDDRGHLRFFDTLTGLERHPLPKSIEPVDALAFAPRTGHLATISRTELVLWNIPDGKRLWSAPRSTPPAKYLVIAPDESVIAAVGTELMPISVETSVAARIAQDPDFEWLRPMLLKRGKEKWWLETCSGTDGSVYSKTGCDALRWLGVSDDSASAIGIGASATWWRLPKPTSPDVKRLNSEYGAIAISTKAGLLALSRPNDTIELRRLTALEIPIATLGNATGGLSFSGSGSRLATVDRDAILVWDTHKWAR